MRFIEGFIFKNTHFDPKSLPVLNWDLNQSPVFGALGAWVLGLPSLRPRFVGRLISWCTNGPKSYVGGSPHVLAEMERNLWVIRQTLLSSPTEPLEIQTD